ARSGKRAKLNRHPLLPRTENGSQGRLRTERKLAPPANFGWTRRRGMQRGFTTPQILVAHAYFRSRSSGQSRCRPPTSASFISTRPGSLSGQRTRFLSFLNRPDELLPWAAKALGVTIPTAILLRADEVIE